MIVRVWRGWTSRAGAAEYEALFRAVVLPEVTGGVAGYRGMELLSRADGEEVEFTTLFWFDSWSAVQAFAGDEVEAAVVPEAVRAVLLRWQDRVSHHEVVLRQAPGGSEQP